MEDLHEVYKRRRLATKQDEEVDEGTRQTQQEGESPEEGTPEEPEEV